LGGLKTRFQLLDPPHARSAQQWDLRNQYTHAIEGERPKGGQLFEQVDQAPAVVPQARHQGGGFRLDRSGRLLRLFLQARQLREQMPGGPVEKPREGVAEGIRFIVGEEAHLSRSQVDDSHPDIVWVLGCLPLDVSDLSRIARCAGWPHRGLCHDPGLLAKHLGFQAQPLRPLPAGE
jgi:hypothetical protein